MTNEEKWNLLSKDIESPETYIKMGFLFLIAAALQRRVWIPFGTNNLFPNLYVIFVGPPGVGKGRVITLVSELIKTPKRSLQKKEVQIETNLDKVDKMSPEELANYTDMLKKELSIEEVSNALFPVLPDSASLRSLTSCVAKSFRTCRYKVVDPITGQTQEKIYGHSSTVFILEELSDLLKDTKETVDLCRFLNRAWDCGDFKHETYHSGKDEIKLMCVSLLAGVTPDGMREYFNSRILAEGFSSRTLFIWADKNRFLKWKVGTLTQLQEQVKKELVDYLKKLAELCGPVVLSPAADAYMQNWYENESTDLSLRANQSLKMEHYYSRKKMHLLKVAMAVHFAESTTMTLEVDDIVKAKAVLEELEKTMHHAVQIKGRNELQAIAIAILHYLRKQGPKSVNEIYVEFISEVRDKLELSNVMSILEETKQVTSTKTGTNKIYMARS